jgi:hypothetical protein
MTKCNYYDATCEVRAVWLECVHANRRTHNISHVTLATIYISPDGPRISREDKVSLNIEFDHPADMARYVLVYFTHQIARLSIKG